MFPPAPALVAVNIDEDDCSWEDVSAPLPIIAQRLYNDEVRRLLDLSGSTSRLKRRALTASFIGEFAEETGAVVNPTMPETYASMLRDFSVLAVAAGAQGVNVARDATTSDTVTAAPALAVDAAASSETEGGFGAAIGGAAFKLHGEAKEWLGSGWQMRSSLTALGVGALVVGSVAGARTRGARLMR